jgi:gas vesicle protein
MSDNGNTFLGLIAGTAIGFVLGVLFAPDKGVNTRQKLKEEVSLAKDLLETKAQELKDQVESTTKEKSLEDQVESLVSNASFKAEEIITALEQKLKDLKEKNKELQKTT